MDRESNNRIIGYIAIVDESLREKEESKVRGKGFPRYVQSTCLIGELYTSRLYLAAI